MAEIGDFSGISPPQPKLRQADAAKRYAIWLLEAFYAAIPNCDAKHKLPQPFQQPIDSKCIKNGYAR
jgi:hypothetical protein